MSTTKKVSKKRVSTPTTTKRTGKVRQNATVKTTDMSITLPLKSKTLEVRGNYRTEMNANEFISLPIYNKNREIEKRSPRIEKLLRNQLPTHLEVAVGLVTKPFDIYKVGDLFKLNGNTRSHIWGLLPELTPKDKLDVKVYCVDSSKYTKQIYDSIDSQLSVETSSDKLTGLLRERKYTAISKIVREGKFKTAINNCVRYAHNEDGLYLDGAESRKNWSLKLDFFWEELKYLDSLNLDKLERYSANTLTSLLLILKRYGTHNKRFELLFKNLSEGITMTNDKNSMDGVHYVYNDIYAEYKETWKVTGFSNAFIVVSKILWGFDNFMNNTLLPKKGNKRKDTFFKEFYQDFLD